jgi:Uma2 family endonuclease
MATKTLLTVEQYAALQEPEGVRYELSQGELIVTPSASLFHNELRDELNSRLRSFVKSHNLGRVTSETDMVLVGEVVRRPDVAFIRSHRLQGVDIDQSPLPVSPDLAVEIVSKNDRAEDLLVKVSQYLEAGAQAVWLIYPNSRLAYRYLPGKPAPDVRREDADDKFEEPELLPGFSVPLAEIFA